MRQNTERKEEAWREISQEESRERKGRGEIRVRGGGGEEREERGLVRWPSLKT